LLNELLTDALTHAFPSGQAGTIHVTLRQETSGQCVLIVWDSEVSFPVDVDFRTTESLGLQLVCLLSEQLGGTVELGLDAGTAFTVTFPL
jgi:two-component sensor histidine kinase